MLSIFTPRVSPRHTYIFREILERRLGLTFRLTDDRTAFQQWTGAKLIYASRPEQTFGDFPWLWSSTYLTEEGLFHQRFERGTWEGVPTIYHDGPGASFLPFDLFGAAFFLLSRHEEYLAARRDVHGRFQASDSTAHQQGFLNLPIIDLWVDRLRKKLQTVFPQLQMQKSSFQPRPTYDIDYAWAYRAKGLLRSMLGTAKDLSSRNWNRLGDRLQTWMHTAKDPFDCYQWLDDLHRELELQAVYFFLVGSYGPYDKNANPGARSFQKLVRGLSETYPVGLHPSYRSNGDPQVLQAEYNRLQSWMGRPLIHSRQHYLKLHLPETYRHLLDLGIRHDYTMGYASQVGFRASTCKPFQWYDLKKDTETSLTIHPFCLMDVTLKDYLQLRPEAALQTALELQESVRAVGGCFSTIWHNSSFYTVDGWDGWQEVYQKIWQIARQAN